MSPEAPGPDDVAAFRAGESACFEALFARYSPYLAAVARPFARDADDLRELIQRAWTRIYERRLAFEGRGSLLGWMMAVCRRECLGRTRREKVRLAAETAYSAALEAASGPEATEPLSPSERRSIHAAVAALPPRQRDAVLLRILEGRSTREAAGIMGCAEGTVKALLHQGVERLRESMGGSK